MFDNQQQYNFFKLFSEGIKVFKLGNYEIYQKVLPFLTEPYAILIQYHQFLATNPNFIDYSTQSSRSEIWMPKKALISESKFSEKWKKLINPVNSSMRDHDDDELVVDEIDIDGGDDDDDDDDEALQLPGADDSSESDMVDESMSSHSS